MDTLRPSPSRLLRRLVLLPGLLLLLGLVVGGVHSHLREDAAHACAICALSHAPATTTVAHIEPAPASHVERVALAAVSTPRATPLASRHSRAPPSI
jgi:hypothetical protein